MRVESGEWRVERGTGLEPDMRERERERERDAPQPATVAPPTPPPPHSLPLDTVAHHITPSHLLRSQRLTRSVVEFYFTLQTQTIIML